MYPGKIKRLVESYNLKRDLKNLHKPLLRPRKKWLLMRIAKKLDLDIKLGEKFGWDYDEGDFISSSHWHFKHPPYVVYRNEY